MELAAKVQHRVRFIAGFVFCVGVAWLNLACSSAPPKATIIREGTTFTADPDPILVDAPGKLGMTTLSWRAPVATVQVRVGSANGPLMASEPKVGHAQTGLWVKNGLVFYLQDGTVPDPTAASATLATLAVQVTVQ